MTPDPNLTTGRALPRKPIPIEPQFELIPAELRERPQWVVWRYMPDGKKWTKVPYDPQTGKPAKSNDPETWQSFDCAAMAYQEAHGGPRPYDGIGYVFAADDPYCGADFDHCFDEIEDSKVLRPDAAEWIERFNSYTEFSVSGGGLHAIMKARPFRNFKNNEAGREIYDRTRFFIFTGLSYHEEPRPIAERQEEADAFVSEYSPRKKNEPKPEPTPKGNGSAGGGYATWEDLRAELGRRIAAHKTARKNSLGNIDCQGICHNGEGGSGLYYSPSKNTAHCNKGCDQATVLRAFGLPDEPDFTRPETRKRQPDIEADIEAEWREVFQRAVIEEPVETVFDDATLLADHGNAARFLNAYRQTTRYVYARKKFLSFDGKRWNEDQGIVEDRANRIVQGLRQIEADNLQAQEKAFKHYVNSQKPERRAAILSLIRAEVRISFEDFDANPELFNVSNGTVDLASGELLEHSPAHLCTKMARIKYRKDARCPKWLRFLLGIFNKDKALIRFIQKAVGYSLSGLTVEQVFFLLYGIGKNGKTTFINVLSRLIGEYATHAQMEVFTARSRSSNGHSEDLARLRGARLVTAIETEESKRLSEALIKQITGGDPVTASYKHEHSFTFTPVFKLWLAANHKPVIRGTDEGIWRRPLMIPFLVQFEKDAEKAKRENLKVADRFLEGKLLSELPGILNWAVEGYRLWKEEGLTPPQQVRDATEQYRKDSDVLGMFIEQKLEEMPDRSRRGASAGQIYKTYCRWCEDNGEYALNQTRFGNAMSERGFSKRKDAGTVHYFGVQLIEAQSDEPQWYQ